MVAGESRAAGRAVQEGWQSVPAHGAAHVRSPAPSSPDFGAAVVQESRSRGSARPARSHGSGRTQGRCPAVVAYLCHVGEFFEQLRPVHVGDDAQAAVGWRLGPTGSRWPVTAQTRGAGRLRAKRIDRGAAAFVVGQPVDAACSSSLSESSRPVRARVRTGVLDGCLWWRALCRHLAAWVSGGPRVAAGWRWQHALLRELGADGDEADVTRVRRGYRADVTSAGAFGQSAVVWGEGGALAVVGGELQPHPGGGPVGGVSSCEGASGLVCVLPLGPGAGAGRGVAASGKEERFA
ncbi:hypothetical protein SGLAM104S_04069 [Streptomyces glaucescens]